jgi:hypothetical protein
MARLATMETNVIMLMIQLTHARAAFAKVANAQIALTPVCSQYIAIHQAAIVAVRLEEGTAPKCVALLKGVKILVQPAFSKALHLTEDFIGGWIDIF